MASYVVEQILKAKKITDYLSSKGFHPKGQDVNGKLKYYCPFHEENTPSFFVYMNGEFQNYYCYSCKKRYHIIHLYRDLESVSIGDAILALSGDLDLNIDSEISHAIAEIENDRTLRSEFTPPEIALIVGRQLYEFLQRVEKNSESITQVEKIEVMIDKALEDNDIETLTSLYDNLQDTLFKAIHSYDLKKEQKYMAIQRAVNN